MSAGCLAVPLPQSRFLFPGIDVSRHSAASLINGAGRSQRPFPRPQRLPPLRGLHSGVKGPGLPLRNLPACYCARSTLNSPAFTWFAPVQAVSSLWARCAFTRWLDWLLPGLHSPSGFLRPSGSKRSTGSPPFGSPSESARFPFMNHQGPVSCPTGLVLYLINATLP